MKTLNAKEYKYLGVKDNWHVFECVKSNFDPEVLYLYRARVIQDDGSSKFYDPVDPSAEYHVSIGDDCKVVCEVRRQENRVQKAHLLAYSTCVKSSTQVKPNPRMKRFANV
jgi:hypothetical protein